MSAKWIRSKQWDDDNFPKWAWPAKLILRTFSSIPLAVVLLSFIVVYSTLASVPVGLLALAPTYLIYFATLVASIALLSIVPTLILRTLWKPSATHRTVRFIISLAALILLALLAIELWAVFAWPRLRYDAAHQSGFRLFGPFVDQYSSTTLRRLPGFEMSEPEFYSWWPLLLILALFVINMIVATVRRIEFTFPNLGVLTVHTGIVTITLGSIYYRGLKVEGDTLLLSGAPGPDGSANVGPIQDRFYDNQTTALWLNQNSPLWDQRPIQPPRYNDYGLGVLPFSPTADAPGYRRTLDAPVRAGMRSDKPVIDADLRFRIVGYASYATPSRAWVAAEPEPDEKPIPLRSVKVRASFPNQPDTREAFRFTLFPDSPAQRIGEAEGAIGIEWTRGMPEARWNSITAKLPPGTLHALDITIPGDKPEHAVIPITSDQTVSLGGYSISVKELAAKPPFPIITEGYRNAQSSVAVLRITPPGDGAKPYDRWVYHRFPEISQDLLDELNDRGMPKRRNADPSIQISYINASHLQVNIDETAPGSARAAIRLDTGEARIVEGLKKGSVLEEVLPRKDPATQPRVDLVLDDWLPHAAPIEFPRPVPESDRDKQAIGTHVNSMLAVEVSSNASPLSNTPLSDAAAWRKVVWLPFTRFQHVETDKHREVTLPDGRKITMAFGRLAHRFPNFFIQLKSFDMIAYDHRGSPRDYQSVIRVIPSHDSAEMSFKPYEHVTKLNAPLQAPFIWSEDRSYFSNMWGTLRSRLDARQFKLSQAGWDAEGWKRSQQMADRGEIPRPFASFTILGVGNNPGIHIIALGGILMSIGIPWAFYIKPLILQRRKRKIQQQLASGTYNRPHSADSTPESQGASS